MNDLPVKWGPDSNMTFARLFSAWTSTNEMKQKLINLLLDYGYTTVTGKNSSERRNQIFLNAIQAHRSLEQERCELVVQLLHIKARKDVGKFPIVLVKEILSFY